MFLKGTKSRQNRSLPQNRFQLSTQSRYLHPMQMSTARYCKLCMRIVLLVNMYPLGKECTVLILD